MSSLRTNRYLRALAGIGTLVILVPAGVFAGREGFTGSRALMLVVGGSVAVLVLGFPWRDLVTALRHGVSRLAHPGEVRRSARVWKAAARNAWVLGAIGATTAFVAHFCSFVELDEFVVGLGDVAVSLTWGLGLAALCGIPALRLSRTPGEGELSARTPPSLEPQAAFTWGRLPAYGLLAVLVTWPLLSSVDSPRFEPADFLLHWPATLVVAGGGLAVALYLGFPRNREALTLGLASAGALGALLGLTQALRGIAGGSIESVSGGLTFTVSACFASLVGLAAFGLPMQDRARGLDDETPSVASRVAWYAIPFLALACLTVTTLLILTPMKKKVSPHDPDQATAVPVSRLEAGSSPGPGLDDDVAH